MRPCDMDSGLEYMDIVRRAATQYGRVQSAARVYTFTVLNMEHTEQILRAVNGLLALTAVRRWTAKGEMTVGSKRHCMNCGGKLKFYGISCQPIQPDDEVKLRWYKCTQCGAMEWRMCNG